MFGNFLMKKMLKSQMKDVPEAEQEKIIKIVEKNPGLFQRIAQDMKVKMDGGMEQMEAAMAVMKEHETEIKKALEE